MATTKTRETRRTWEIKDQSQPEIKDQRPHLQDRRDEAVGVSWVRAVQPGTRGIGVGVVLGEIEDQGSKIKDQRS